MSEPRVLILTGLGLNCEAETEAAFAMAGARPEKVHLLDLLDGSAPRKLSDSISRPGNWRPCSSTPPGD